MSSTKQDLHEKLRALEAQSKANKEASDQIARLDNEIDDLICVGGEG